MRTLLVDNYDSYTFNLFQLIAGVNGVDPVVVVNDDPALGTMRLDDFDNIVISPGPGRPQNSRDIGYVADLLRRTTLPVLGVCLGHQAIALAYGARVVPARHLMHGKTSHIRHDGRGLFAGVPDGFAATRYHSLVVLANTVPDCLEVTARSSDDGYIMGLRHRVLPMESVQFHPESIGTAGGMLLISNFVNAYRDFRAWAA